MATIENCQWLVTLWHSCWRCCDDVWWMMVDGQAWYTCMHADTCSVAVHAYTYVVVMHAYIYCNGNTCMHMLSGNVCTHILSGNSCMHVLGGNAWHACICSVAMHACMYSVAHTYSVEWQGMHSLPYTYSMAMHTRTQWQCIHVLSGNARRQKLRDNAWHGSDCYHAFIPPVLGSSAMHGRLWQHLARQCHGSGRCHASTS
jgi:hypothetical protein